MVQEPQRLNRPVGRSRCLRTLRGMTDIPSRRPPPASPACSKCLPRHRRPGCDGLLTTLFADSPWTAVRYCGENDGIALIPFGSLEQHGPHLPCGTDTFEIDQIISRATSQVAQALSGCVCPTIEYSVVQWASPWPHVSPRYLPNWHPCPHPRNSDAPGGEGSPTRLSPGILLPTT